MIDIFEDMKLILSVLWLVVCMSIPVVMQAQCDYTGKKYPIQSEINVLYGTATGWNGSTDSLRLDIYKPVGDNNPKRPVLIIVHGGGFYGGNRAEMKPLCEAFASRGLMVATISYRLGFVRPLQFDYPYTLDAAEVERAAYRGQQDVKGAIRYLKARSGKDSSDRQKFFVSGFSAGGFIALATGYSVNEIYKPASCGAIGNAQNSNGTWARPDLGSINGTLNLNGQDASVQGVFNFFGALFDTAHLMPGSPKLFQYHQTADPVVPCNKNKPYHGVGLLIPDNYPLVYGSCQINDRLMHLGNQAPENYSFLYNGNKHEVHNPVMLDTMMATWLSRWICAAPVAGIMKLSMHETQIYPNPAANVVKLVNGNNFNQAEFYHANGQLASAVAINSAAIDVSFLPDGIYTLILSGNGQNVYKKLIINRR